MALVSTRSTSKLRHGNGFGLESLESRQMLSAAVAPITHAKAGVKPVVAAAPLGLPPRQVENLGRGVVAVRATTSQAYVSWRILGLDPAGIGFNVYRSANGATPVKLNPLVLTAGTNYTDGTADFTKSNAYSVRPVINGVEQASSAALAVLAANTPVRQYLSVPLQVPPGGHLPGTADTVEHDYTYSANDTSVGDVDGDGEYEYIVKWDPSDSKDNSQDGYTGNVYIDAYKLDGRLLWRIDLGRNIRAGAHYTQFMVYDLDGDGRAEVAMKTAPGTIDGTGKAVLLGTDTATADYRTNQGYILSGPEYFTIFNGRTGAAMATTGYVPPRGSVSSWGDGYGNRVDRFLAGVAYLDGEHPSVIMARGYYTRAVVAAWDWRGGQLTNRWTFDSNSTPGGSAVAGQGSHSLLVADVDGDGKDEIQYGAAAIDDNGTMLYSTRLGHGDAEHISDMDPSRPGLESFMVHEDPGSYTKNGVSYGGDLRDARTGEILFAIDGHGADVGRGVAFDVDPRYPGYEMWTSSDGQMYNVSGQVVMNTAATPAPVSRPGNYNFGVWWDADPLRELLTGGTIDKWNWNTGSLNRVLTAYQQGATACNGSKATPNVSADLFGDWREEVVWHQPDSSALMIFTTTIATTTRMPTLMHDVQYREAIAWQNTAYNQPPHPSFFLGDGMAAPPAANVVYAAATPTAPPPLVYQAEAATRAANTPIANNYAGYNSTGFADFPTTGGSARWNNVDGGAGGTTTVGFRFANGGTTARVGRLTVNGVAQNITFGTTAAWTAWGVVTASVPLTAGRTNTVLLESTGQDLGNVDELQVSANAPPAPTFFAALIGDGTAQRSMVKTWTVTFDRPVNLAAGAVTLTAAGGSAVPIQQFNPTFDGRTYVFTVGGSGLVGGSVADGNYTLSMHADLVSDSFGQPLSGPDRTFTFFRLFGDFDGDRDVDTADFNQFRTVLNLPTRYNPAYDSNGDGRVDNLDLLAFRQRYGTRLPA